MSDQKHVQSLQLFPLYTRVVTEKDTVFGVFCEHLEKSGVTLMDGDVVLVTSKIVSLAEDGVSVDTDLKPSEAASSLAKESLQTPGYCQAILEDSDKVLGCLPHVVATLHDGIMIANAGIDQSNVGGGAGRFIRLPRNPDKSAVCLVKAIRERFGVRVGVIITDSVVHALRRGTSGIALSVAGIKSVVNEVGKPDIFGRKMGITERAIADNIACAALLLMGETDECKAT